MSASDAIAILRRSFGGRLSLPDDAGFDAARAPWNLSIDQHPAAVAHPRDVDDLGALIVAARETGTPLAVQPGGHGAGSDVTGAFLVRMGGFDALEIDTDAGTAVIGAGVRWGRVIDALEGSGWVAPAGSSPVVSAAGYTLGGGHSLFSRTSGLGSDNLRAAWVMRTDGRHERVDDASDPDLMWALRGAGGVAGVVTALEIDLVPAPAVWGASAVFDIADAEAVIRGVRDLAPSVPLTLNVTVTSNRMPDAPQLPEAIRGKSFLTVQMISTDGPVDDVLELVRSMAPVLREVVGQTSPAAIAAQSGEPTDPTPSRGASAALAVLDDATIDALVAFHRHDDQWPVIGIEFRMLGGELASPRREGFAGLESAGWLVYALAPLFPGAPIQPGDASLALFRELVAPASAERTVPTFLTPGQTLADAATDETLARLRALRERFDPEGILHHGRLPR
jgi:FAD/FMN-containing dehydrogenase